MLALLAQDTLDRLRTRFASYGVRPSPEMWAGIADLALCLQRMADGEADRTFYLSSLDPGVGKTQTVVERPKLSSASCNPCCIRLLYSPRHQHVGAVAFMFTKDEIKTFVQEAREAGLPEDAFAARFAARVHKDDREVNELGCGDPDRARILFTTPQRLLTICTGRRFGSAR